MPEMCGVTFQDKLPKVLSEMEEVLQFNPDIIVGD